jgi:hypothetical protein
MCESSKEPLKSRENVLERSISTICLLNDLTILLMLQVGRMKVFNSINFIHIKRFYLLSQQRIAAKFSS